MDSIFYGLSIGVKGYIYRDDKLGERAMEKLKELWDGTKSIWTDLKKSQKIFVVALVVIIVIAIIK